MKKLTEGNKMYITVMAIFIVYAVVFIIFDDIDRNKLMPLDEANERNLLLFAIVVVVSLSYVLHRYAKRMDVRIKKEQTIRQTKQRRQLTQNIAHELKTPVSSILGYTETILENPDLDSKKQLQFIERCHKQALRLTNLLQDLSTLNRMDSVPEMIEKQPTNVSEIVENIVQEVCFSLEQHHIILHNNLPKDIFLSCNAPLVYSIFRNLFDNAINYAGPNTTITISAAEQKSHYCFHFRDNGCGVPTNSLPRLFERFYRIDSGRSRTMGGTGLGLAIVKNAVLLHNGTITAYNDSGLCFDFTLKK